MSGHKYASYEDFEREEYLSVRSFYSNLEEIADEGMFTAEEDEDDTFEREASARRYAVEMEL